MANTKAMSLEDLRAEVARLDAEQVEAARQAMLELDADRADYYRDLVARGKALDEMLEIEGKDAADAATAALTVGDLNGAFAGWCGWTRSRRVRQQIRSQVQSGANVLGVQPYSAAELNTFTGTFTDWLGGQEHHAVEAGVAERVQELIGTIPGMD